MDDDWQQYLQSIILGLIFSYLLAKLFSTIISFRHDNLHLTRSNSNEFQLSQSKYETSSEDSDQPLLERENKNSNNNSFIEGEYSGGDSDDDWEGIESSELDDEFSAATAFVAATAADRSGKKVSSELQLRLYGLYKIATEGPCGVPQPSAIKMTARAKWQAWQKLGAIPQEEAMQQYIDIVTELYPTWAAGSTKARKGEDGSDAPSTDNKGPMGPVFSTYVNEEESENDLKMDDIHVFAREGEVENLLKCVEGGVSVDLKDSEGRTPLHWAVDRGHLNITELLVNRNADVNAKDNEGQTPLHYAVVCERESIAEFLVKQKADREIKDDDGNSPCDLCESNWLCMQHS